MRPWILLATVLASCGARTGVSESDAAPPAPPPPAPPSCWLEPNCIEADIESADGSVLLYRELAEPAPVSNKIWLEGAVRDGVWLFALVFRDATPGINHYDYTDGNVFVSIQNAAGTCSIVDDITLVVVDTRSGGVTEGTFAGQVPDCDHAIMRNGRFRLTVP